METIESAVVGLGNPIRKDDAVGLVVARAVCRHLEGKRNAHLIEATSCGLHLIERLVGYGRAVVIDAIQSDAGVPGEYYRIDVQASMAEEAPAMTHQIGLLEGLVLARRIGMDVPAYLRVYAMEVADPHSYGEGLTEAVRLAVPRLTAVILSAEFGMQSKPVTLAG